MKSCAIPTLTTERLTLRAPRVDEFEAYAALFTSPRARFMGEFDRAGAWKEFASEMGLWLLYGFGPFHMERRDDGALVGAVALLKHDFYPETELGWHLYDGFEGHGYASESAKAALDWAFETHGFDTLVSYIDPENAGSIAVAERLGAVLDPNARKVDPEDLVYRHSARGRLQ
ncbi:MAG: GNAT family N-acetyltransferase [Pseudomonadota bacterium]